MDPATGDTLNSESYQCPLGPAVSFFAGLWIVQVDMFDFEPLINCWALWKVNDWTVLQKEQWILNYGFWIHTWGDTYAGVCEFEVKAVWFSAGKRPNRGSPLKFGAAYTLLWLPLSVNFSRISSFKYSNDIIFLSDNF
jgi:hypothetical protein